MAMLTHRRLRLPSHYYVLYDPPDDAGDETLHFISECRKVKVKGHSFREFQQSVIPLLNGVHTFEEIAREVADIFAPEDLEACLHLLAEQNLIEDAEECPLSPDVSRRLEPQLNFFHEVSPNPYELQRRLESATVTVIGLGGAGASAVLSLAAAQVGALRCIDELPVAPADPYLASIFSPGDVGVARVEVVRRSVGILAPQVKFSTYQSSLETDADLLTAIQGSNFVICCTDPAQASLAYKLNRVCLRAGIRWTSCTASGPEVVVGPTVHPLETACYLCYKMRMVACAENPEDEFAFQRFLDRRMQDDSGRRENLVFGTGLAGNLLGLEALKVLTGMTPPSLLGRVAVIDLMSLTLKKHLILRKPWCPACFDQQPEDHGLTIRQASVVGEEDGNSKTV
jgi:bacteriocin biosynthesis cyclodehydratase domain-containing protein